jgi:hypothetical protein
MTKYILTIYGSKSCRIVWNFQEEDRFIKVTDLSFGCSNVFTASKNFISALKDLEFEGPVIEKLARRAIVAEILDSYTPAMLTTPFVIEDKVFGIVAKMEVYIAPTARIEFTS